MWYKVTGRPEPVEEASAPSEELNHASPFSAAIDPMDWPEAIFIVNARTGLTITANRVASGLFEAGNLAELTGVDLTSLFAKQWTTEANRSFREQLQSGKSAISLTEFKTLKGRVFKGVLQIGRAHV